MCQLAVYQPEEIRQPLPETLARLPRPDLVVIEGVALMAQALACRAAWPGVPLVFDFHNVESNLLRQIDRARLPALLRPLAGVLFRRRWQAAEELDRQALEMADRVWLCSEDDRALALELCPEAAPRLSVLPNTMPQWCEGATPRDTRAFSAPEVLFVGHLGYAPNKHAARRLAADILPALRRDFPEARLTIAGRSPNRRLRRDLARHDNVTLVADPAEVAPLYDRADLTILPLTEGGGSRIKVLEALATGCPIVASAKAVEGLALEPGRHYLPAESAAEAASATARLMREPETRAQLIAEGAQLVRARYSQATIDRLVTEDIARLLSNT